MLSSGEGEVRGEGGRGGLLAKEGRQREGEGPSETLTARGGAETGLLSLNEERTNGERNRDGGRDRGRGRE